LNLGLIAAGLVNFS